jgi:hypothetical protein
MLNFMSPWMTQLTREIHDGKKEPQRNMNNRKPFIRSGSTPYTGARKAKTLASLTSRVEEHPNDAKAAARLATLLASS